MVDAHGFGKDNDIGDFAELGRLNVEGQEGETQPALVAGVAFDAEDQQHSDKEGIKDKEHGSLAGENFNIEDGQRKVDDDTGEQAAGLDNDITGVIAAGGGSIDHYDAKYGGNDAKCQQNHVAFLRDFFYFFAQSLHALTSSTGY